MRKFLKIGFALQLILFMTIGLILPNPNNSTPILSIKNTNLSLKTSDWSNATCISDLNRWNTGLSQRAKIATDIYGNIHVVWMDNTIGEWGTDLEIMYANRTASGWSNATCISDIYGWNDGSSWYPDIITDKNGNLHVVWHDQTDGQWGTDQEIMYANRTASGWSNATCISGVYGWNDGESYVPSIGIDANGDLHVVWYDDTDGQWGTDFEIMYANRTASGWSNATCISGLYGWNDGESNYCEIAVDKNNDIHVVWNDNTDGEWGTDIEIMYTNRTAGVWSNATCISGYGWNNADSFAPKIAVDNNLNIHVIWQDGTAGEWGTDVEIMYANRTATGWSNATVISDDATKWNTNSSRNPEIAMDKNGNIYAVWDDDTYGEWGTDKEIMYAQLTATGWTNATCISGLYTWNDDRSNNPSIAVDDNGNIHVVWEDYTDGEWETDVEIMYVNLIKGTGQIDLITLLLAASLNTSGGSQGIGIGIMIGIVAVVIIIIVVVANKRK